MFQTKLRELMESKNYVSIYRNRDKLTAFEFGLVVGCNDDSLILASFSPNGENDGLLLIEMDSICKLESDNLYTQKMRKLIQYHQTKHEEYSFRDNFIVEMLEYSRQKAFIVSVEICNSGYLDATGLFELLSEDGCRILIIDEYGNENGYADIEYLDITEIKINDCEERYRGILYQMQKQK